MADWLGNTASAAWARELWDQARLGYEDFRDSVRFVSLTGEESSAPAGHSEFTLWPTVRVPLCQRVRALPGGG
jgi:hypothetical protein